VGDEASKFAAAFSACNRHLWHNPPMPIPSPNPDALTHSERLRREIARRIRECGGWIPFAGFMEAALYTPGLGYYAAGAQKFGAGGDFVTAPELSPLFAAALARQVAEIMAMSAPCVLEAGAGSGRLAADLLLALEALSALPERYAILEISTNLRARQQALLQARVPRLVSRVEWLTAPPERLEGLVLANEVLDAMPVHCAVWRGAQIEESGVALDERGTFISVARPATGRLLEAALAIAREASLPEGFVSEIPLIGPAWVADWGRRLARGALLLIDYGFPRREFYHPQRQGGTLMCHYRHHAHTDPFFLPGLQDITAHVDFTALAEAGFKGGLELLGYTDQARFLLNCGLLEAFAALAPGSRPYLEAAAAVQKLVQPQEMGELFKVMALGKGIKTPLLGFLRGDRQHAL
jgi:SAM-dependent MidA family methyltransferase